jgi:branched-chain amino acid transport system substrate-binding protein
MKALVAVLASAVFLYSSMAESETTVTVGVLTDMSSLYRDNSGPGSVEAARMAVEDFRPDRFGMTVRVVSADHQNKADVGSTIARRWYDVEGVDAIVDVPNSAIALAVSNITKDKNKVLLVSSAGSSDIVGSACSPNTILFTYDTWALAQTTGRELVKEGGRNWYFLTADYAFGHALERDASTVVEKSGGKVLGTVRIPINNSDFSSFLLQAQSSKADVIALANSGADFTNAMKQAAEFGLASGRRRVAGLLVFISDIRALGIKATQGLAFTTAFYWDFDDHTREWSKRFAARNNGHMPTMGQAGVYSATRRYLASVAKLGSSHDGRAIVREIESNAWDDPLFGPTSVRVDGRALHRMLFVEVKQSAESKTSDDLYRIKRVIPASDAFRPLADGGCPLR